MGDKSREFAVIILLVVLYCGGSYGQAIDCNNKSFICVNQTHFFWCDIDGSGTFRPISTTPGICVGGNTCSNTDEFECFTVPALTTTRRPTTTTRRPTTTTRRPTTTTRRPTTTRGPTTRGSSTTTTRGSSTTRGPITTTRSSTTSKPTTTRKPITTTKRVTPKPGPCTSIGYIPDHTVPYCKGFIRCVPQGSGFIAVKCECPGLSVFHPTQRICSMCHQCSGSSLCTKPGRQIDPTDKTCKQYYLCSRNRYGGFNRDGFRCPGRSVFSSIKESCVKNNNMCIPAPTPSPPSPSVVCVRPFTYFPDRSVPNCRGYITCVPRNGKLQPVKGLCLFNWIFDFNRKHCVFWRNKNQCRR